MHKLRAFTLVAERSADDSSDLFANILTNYPNLTSLETNLDFAYQTTCSDEELGAIFSKIENFKLAPGYSFRSKCFWNGNDNLQCHDESLQFLGRVLPLCSKTKLESLLYDGLVHADLIKHPNLELINTFDLQSFSSTQRSTFVVPNISSCRTGLGFHRTSVSLFELDWSNLKELHLEKVGSCCFDKICEYCPSLLNLKLSSPRARCNDLDYFHLSSLTKLQTLELDTNTGIEELLLREMNQIFEDCNQVFSGDHSGARLDHFPDMKFFRVNFSFSFKCEGSLFEYIMRKTCMGEIKRSILTDGMSMPLSPSEVTAGKDLPREIVDHLFEHAGMVHKRG